MKTMTLIVALVLSAINQLPANPPIVVGSDGEYLGTLSANPYEPQSISNPYGLYGSQYSPVSVSDKFGLYGSPYSNESLNNEYLVSEPKLEERVIETKEIELEEEEK